MKKIIAFLIALTLCLSFCLSASAANVSNVYTFGDVDVVFAENSSFDADVQQYIADIMINGDDGTTAYNLWCNLFGHKETIESVETITHKARTLSPRCLSQLWEIHACTRCNEVLEQILLSQAYIVCCPEE